MKGLNIKRIAAIGLGAALVGSALAPAVMAGAFNNLSQLKKENIVDTAGMPVVDIVVGSAAQASDVVWAGNIAAKVAQMAVSPVAGSGSGSKTVDVTVGGTSVVSGGARDLITSNLNSTTNTQEYSETVGNTYFKTFANTTYNATTDGNTTFSVSVNETVGALLDARMNITNQNVKDLVAEVDPNDINYTMSITNGNIPKGYLDNGTEDYIPVSFLGQKYVVDSVSSDGSSVVLVSDNAEQLYSTGDKITSVMGVDGSDYELQFVSGLSSGSSFLARIALLDASGNKVQEQTFSAGSDVVFRDNQGKELLKTKVRLKNVYTNGSSTDISYSFSVLVGNDRIEIRNGREVPYDPNSNGSNVQWIASITYSGSNLATITIKNNNYYMNGDKPLYSPEYSFNAADKNTEFDLFGNTGVSIGKILFKGFYDSGVQKSTVSFKKGQNVAAGTTATSYGAVEYTDGAGQSHSVPMAIYLNPTSGLGSGQTFQFEGTDHAYATDGTTGATNFYIKANQTDVNLLAASSPTIVTIAGNDVNFTTSVALTGKNSKTYTYLAKRGINNGVYLVLAGADSNSLGPATGLIDQAQFSTGSILFAGTSLNDAAVSTSAADFNTTGALHSNGTNVPYYYPDIYDFNGEQSGSSTYVYRTAVFVVSEVTRTTLASAILQNKGHSIVFVDTEGGNSGSVDTANIAKLSYSGKTTAVEYYGLDQNLVNFSEYLGNPGESSANYKKAYTSKGTKIVLDGREVTFTLPDQNMKARFLVQSNDVTTTTSGGTTYTIGVGETMGGVTVNAISGPTTGVAVNPVGNLVKLDSDASFGKSIVVGGFIVNNAAKNLSVDGQTLEERLVASGDYVAAVLDNGSIVAAGYTAEDTGAAATALISALDSL